MAMADENMYKISSRYLQLLHETWQKQALFASFRDFAVIFRNLFFTDFDATKKGLGLFWRSLRKSDLKTCTYRSSKFRKKLFDLFTWWPEMTLTYLMVTKHRKWYLKISVTQSMPGPRLRKFHWVGNRLWHYGTDLDTKSHLPATPRSFSSDFDHSILKMLENVKF